MPSSSSPTSSLQSHEKKDPSSEPGLQGLSEATLDFDSAAYQQFLLTGKRSSTNLSTMTVPPAPTPSNPGSVSSPVPPSHGRPTHSQLKTSNQKNKSTDTQKTLQLAVTSFEKRFVLDWYATDQHLFQVMESIANLRHRLALIGRTMERLPQNDISSNNNNNNNHTTTDDWMHWGYRSSSGTTSLTREDLELSMSYTLLAHERMLTALRHGMSQLNQAQDGLGRRLDNVLAVPMAIPPESPLQERTTYTPLLADHQVHNCLELYRACAQDLYHKQCLVQDVLDSTCDDLVVVGGARSSSSLALSTPLELAQTAVSQWKHTHVTSPLKPFLSVMDAMKQRVDQPPSKDSASTTVHSQSPQPKSLFPNNYS